MAYTLQTFTEAPAPEPEKVSSKWPRLAVLGLILLAATGIWAARYRARQDKEEIVIPRGT